MKKYNLNILCKNFLLMIFLFVMFSCSTKEKNIDIIELEINNKKYKIESTFDLLEQDKKERKIKEVKIEKEFQIGGLEDTTLFSPIQLKVDNKKNIYILDRIDSKVKVFNNNGEFLKSYGRKGQGPGEFLRGFALDISEQGKIAVYDFDQFKCVVFENESSKIINVKPDFTRLRFIKEDLVFSNHKDLKNNHMFIKIDLEGNNKVNYQNLYNFDNVKENYITVSTLEGDHFAKDDLLIFIPTYFNYIATYDKNGKIKYVIKTIDEIKEKPIAHIYSYKEEYIATRYPDQQKYLVVLSSGIADDKIWILSNVAYNILKKNIIDFYSIEDGKYLYSYQIDDKTNFSKIFLDSNRIYVLKADASVEVLKVIE